MLLLSADGTCLGSVPDRPEYRRQSFGDRGWFKAARSSKQVPIYRATDEPDIGRTIKIIQPILRDGDVHRARWSA